MTKTQPRTLALEVTERMDSLGSLLEKCTEDHASMRALLSDMLATTFKTELGRLTPDGRRRIERLLERGRKQRDIAEELGISPPAVSRHVRRLAKIPRSLS